MRALGGGGCRRVVCLGSGEGGDKGGLGSNGGGSGGDGLRPGEGARRAEALVVLVDGAEDPDDCALVDVELGVGEKGVLEDAGGVEGAGARDGGVDGVGDKLFGGGLVADARDEEGDGVRDVAEDGPLVLGAEGELALGVGGGVGLEHDCAYIGLELEHCCGGLWGAYVGDDFGRVEGARVGAGGGAEHDVVDGAAGLLSGGFGDDSGRTSARNALMCSGAPT